MDRISENRYAIGNCLIAVVFLALLTLADNVVASTLPTVLGPGPPQIPGFWNLTTTALILSTVSDLIGQLVLIPATYHYSLRFAMKLNSLSVLAASMSSSSLIPVFQGVDGLAWVPAVAGIFKMIGGGSHAAAFLTITLIQKNASGSLRTVLICTTGAAVVLCQTIASAVTPPLSKRSPILLYLLSIACCILAGIATVGYSTTRSPASDRQRSNDPSRQPLLSYTNQDHFSPNLLGFIKIYYTRWNSKPFITRKVLAILGFIFFVLSISKATRPLFLTYIQYRSGITPELASYLWLARTVMSMVIFTMVLPLAVIVLAKYTSRIVTPNVVTLYTAKIGVIFLAIGAILIGLARPRPVLISGLIINTLGVATDLALLAFAVDVVPEDIATSFFMVLATLESAGTLVGIGFLYPLYQLYLYDVALVGGIPQGFYMIAGVQIWQIMPLVH
ncbi:hypothetical protein F4808DRAFT_453858 [Astrocystis sublimbata]|nr:hypothetical protein F4808DRAFT_453858 [Astrocystis sublimbata]